MKTRNGFVSNSSSSSFVIALSEKPKSVAQVMDLLCDDDQSSFSHPYERQGLAASDVAACVLRDLGDEEAGPLTFDQLVEELMGGWLFYDQLEKEFPYPDREDDPEMIEWRKVCKKRDVRHRELATEYAQAFLKREEIVGKLLFRVEYSDNDGSFYCAMEHGDIFHNIPHVRISHH